MLVPSLCFQKLAMVVALQAALLSVGFMNEVKV